MLILHSLNNRTRWRNYSFGNIHKDWNKKESLINKEYVRGINVRVGDEKMSKFLDRNCRYSGGFTKNRLSLLDVPYLEAAPESPETIRENLKLKKTLKRAVESTTAPHYLIESIRDRIRG